MPDTQVNKVPKKIILGSGKLYAITYAGLEEIPDEDELCQEDNIIGYVQGGAVLEYTLESYSAKDDLGLAQKDLFMADSATLKSGIMTFNGDTIARLIATADSETAGNKRTTMIGGIENVHDSRLVTCFCNKDAVDGNTYVTIVGSNQGALSLAFAKDKESVINLEFKAQPAFEGGRLIRLTETEPEVG